jgi:enoyl-CoA hydratase
MNDVLLRVEGHAGRITLNRPQALNALTLPMVQAISAALTQWAHDPAIDLVIVDGAGDRALCAGGDIRALYDAARAGDLVFPHSFFAAEYAMNAQIAHFPKPYVALMDGVVMGGGVGISAHGSVRIVTERTVLAMPETGIGLFPDVGATWLLSRDLSIGLHLALTGMRIGAADAIAAGLADHMLASETLPVIAAALTTCRNAADIARIVKSQAIDPPAPTITAFWQRACYGQPTMEQITVALAEHEDARAQAAAREIATKSPSSLKVTLRALQQASRFHNLDQALTQELIIALGCMRSHDFVEGVRAAVIDKDRTPHWSPAHLADVTEEMVEAYFR